MVHVAGNRLVFDDELYFGVCNTLSVLVPEVQPNVELERIVEPEVPPNANPKPTLECGVQPNAEPKVGPNPNLGECPRVSNVTVL